MVICYISVGSNLGDRRFYIESAVKKIKTLVNTRVNKVSSIIETSPQGGPPQGPYLNAVLEIETEISPYRLLQELQRIESLLGRVRTVANAARTIDLDILTYGDVCMNEEALCIPHPRMLERDFVMIPLQEIAGEFARNLRSKVKKTLPRKSAAAGKRKAAEKPRRIVKADKKKSLKLKRA